MSHRDEPPDPSADLVTEALLRDGSPVLLRPAREPDADAVLALLRGLSQESLFYRFFSSAGRFVERYARRTVVFDPGRHVSVLAHEGSELLALGSYDRVEPELAEVAFAVADAHQGRGLGTLLLERLSEIALTVGIHTFRAVVVPANRRMLEVFRSAGFEVSSRFVDGLVQIEFRIDPTPRLERWKEFRRLMADAHRRFS